MLRQIFSRSLVIGLFCFVALDLSLALAQFEVFPISVTPGHDYFPKVDGRYVVWTDVEFLGGPPGSTNDVYGYDLLLQERITVAIGPGAQDEPSISGNTVIWTDNAANIFGRDISTSGESFTVTAAPGSQYSHEITGDLVVWADDRNGTPQVWGRKLSEPVSSDFAISSTNASFVQGFPDVSGSVAVWMSFGDPGDPGNIYGRDVNGGDVFPVTTAAEYQFYPKISGRTVVWNDTRDGPQRVYGRNLDSGGDFPISSGVGEQHQVSIDGDLVVWRDDRTGVSDIWGRSLAGGPEFQITDTPSISEDNPDVSGNVVVWQQSTTGVDTDIYGTVIPEPELSVLGFTITLLALVGRRRSADLASM